MEYDPANWYFVVDGADPEVFASARLAFVPLNDEDYTAWLAAGGRPTNAKDQAAVAEILINSSIPHDLLSYAAMVRYQTEIGGLTLNGMMIDTSRDSQAMIANAYAYLNASGEPSVSYKAASGFVTLTAEQVHIVALAVGAHVQACFNTERDVVSKIEADPALITTTAQIDAAFA